VNVVEAVAVQRLTDEEALAWVLRTA